MKDTLKKYSVSSSNQNFNQSYMSSRIKQQNLLDSELQLEQDLSTTLLSMENLLKKIQEEEEKSAQLFLDNQKLKKLTNMLSKEMDIIKRERDFYQKASRQNREKSEKQEEKEVSPHPERNKNFEKKINQLQHKIQKRDKTVEKLSQTVNIYKDKLQKLKSVNLEPSQNSQDNQNKNLQRKNLMLQKNLQKLIKINKELNQRVDKMKKKLQTLKEDKSINSSSNKNTELSYFSSVKGPSNINYDDANRNLLIDMIPKESNEFTINEINKQLLKKLKEKDQFCMQLCSKYELLLQEMRRKLSNQQQQLNYNILHICRQKLKIPKNFTKIYQFSILFIFAQH